MNDYSETVYVTIRVIISEENRSTIKMSCNSNDKVKVIAEEIAVATHLYSRSVLL